MKVRRGFVSNSSSSSFIVAFPSKPESAAELQEMLFGDQETYPCPYYDKGWTARHIAEVVWRDLEEQSPLTLEQVAEKSEGGWIDGQPDFNDFCDKKGETDWDAYEAAVSVFARKYASRFIDQHPDAVFFAFEYSDNDGDMYVAMEHGTLFDKLPHSRISRH